MELFEKEIKRLNQNQKFTEFMSAEEEEEKLQKTLIEDARNDGEKMGLEKGEKVGLKKGEKVGKMKEQFKIAKNMLKNNMSKEVISKITELSIAEIETLK